MHIPKLLLIFMLMLLSTQAVGMKHPRTLNNDDATALSWITIPDDIATTIIAQCEDKDMLRQTCKRFSKLASIKTKKDILTRTRN